MSTSPAPGSEAPLAVADVLTFLRSLAPLGLAEEWDNVGFLLGNESAAVTRAMTCLTLTQDVADEALGRGAQLIVTHHPILFRPVDRVTSETPAGRVLLTLARHGIAVYSAHTAYDNAVGGINQQLAETLELRSIVALRPTEIHTDGHSASAPHGGAGRAGKLVPPRSLGELIARAKALLGLASVDFVGKAEIRIERVAIACGSAADFMEDAAAGGCQVLITGEARFHACVEARDRGMALVLLGHFASERPAMRQLAEQIHRRFPALEVWASTVETDPLARG